MFAVHAALIQTSMTDFDLREKKKNKSYIPHISGIIRA